MTAMASAAITAAPASETLSEPAPLTALDDRLAALFAERAAWVGREAVRPAEMAEDERVALVVLCRFDLPDLVAGARAFAAGLDARDAAGWLHSWTATRFLFGIPANLTGSAQVRVTGPHGSCGWLGPCSPAHVPGTARLLKPVTGTLPVLPASVSIPGRGAPRALYLATRGLTLVDYLVHLHHTLAEAVLAGRLGAEDALCLHHRRDIEPAVAVGEPAYARVHHPDGDLARLRLYSWLSPTPLDEA
jgi:hypothetical protein